MFYLNLIFILLLALSSCTSFNKIPTRFKKEIIKGGEFYITTFHDIKDTSKDYVVYIEGDGFITKDNKNPTNNPTPKNKLVLALAAEDFRKNIVYIARPCQFTPPELNENCNSAYWTSKRWSPEVIDSMNEVIDKITRSGNVHLVGFSGGGGMAVLIGSRNSNVKSIITIAGNLDHVKFNKFHKAKQCTDSLNPTDFSDRTFDIKQIHIVGRKDKIVPEFIVDDFINSFNIKCYERNENVIDKFGSQNIELNKLLENSCNIQKIVCFECSHSGNNWIIFWKKFLHTHYKK
ncbi:MAG: alpha/beta hydrolase [Rickettsiales bacterium]